ncbi:MAG: ATP-binding protein, partial [Chloroflexota bacterium]
REVIDDRLVPNHIMLEEEGGVIGHVCKTGEMVILPDNSAFAEYIPPIEDGTSFKSSLAIPMKTSNSVVGVLNLESKHLNFFTKEQAVFLNSLAGHAAISIDNANLLIEREQQIHTLTLLRELSLEALSFIEREGIYDAVIRTALILLKGTSASLYGINLRDQSMGLLASIQSDDGQMIVHNPVIPEAILQKVREQGTNHFIADVSQEEAFRGFDVPYQSLVIVSITRRLQVRELLCIGFTHQRTFTRQDFDISESLALQVAGHLENASLNEEVTTNNDRMRAILDSTRDGIILLDNQHYIQDANSAAKQLTGIPLEQYLFMPLDTLIEASTVNNTSQAIWRTITDAYYDEPHKIHNQEYELHQDEAVVFIKTLIQHVVDDTGETVGHLLILRDITDEKNLQEFQTMMQSMVLHDLRGPLTSIVTSMYVAENILALYDGSDFDDPQQALMKTLNVSLVSAEDMLRQVDTLRDLPMLNRTQVNPQVVPIDEIAQGAFNSLSANYQDSGIDVEIDIDPTLEVFVDESLIRRVIINLMHNAFKFTPENGKVLLQVNPEASVDSNYIRIDVADTGPGIPEEERERIFGQYVQIKGQKPRAGGKGTGLGLNFCKLAVEAHGGSIWVANDGPLSGACFSFTIPTSEWLSQDS